MANQALNQGSSQGRVSWSDVASPCGVGVFFGQALPSRVRVTSAEGKPVDRVPEGRVRSETGKKTLFCQHDDGFAWVGSRGTLQRDLLGFRGTTCAPLKGPKTVKMARPPYNFGIMGFVAMGGGFQSILTSPFRTSSSCSHESREITFCECSNDESNLL